MRAASAPFFSRAMLAGLLALASCGAPVQRAIEDLAAIHDPSNWTPRSPASLSVAPERYLAERPSRSSGPGLYPIEDHRELELGILNTIASAPTGVPGFALETSAWLAIELLHDDFTEARIQAAAILSSFAGSWIERGGVRLAQPQQVDSEAYARATQAFLDADEAQDRSARLQALEKLARMRAPNSVVMVRTLTGVARRIDRTPLRKGDEELAFRFGATCILAVLEVGAADQDPEVAEACRARFDLLAQYAYRGAPSSP